MQRSGAMPPYARYIPCVRKIMWYKSQSLCIRMWYGLDIDTCYFILTIPSDFPSILFLFPQSIHLIICAYSTLVFRCYCSCWADKLFQTEFVLFCIYKKQSTGCTLVSYLHFRHVSYLITRGLCGQNRR
jgi:hypothetical protein